MGISSSKPVETEHDAVQMKENEANQTLESIGSSSSISPFQRLKNLSLSNRYERFVGSGKPQSMSMNNLEGELTPRKTPNSGLKQRLIKALGGYNLLDPRSPSQLIARTPLNFVQKSEEKGELGRKTLELETSIDSKRDLESKPEEEENPYSIFEENLDDSRENHVEKVSNPDPVEVSIDAFDGLVITKDPRSPSEGIPRTPMTFAVGTLQTPSVEMQQCFVQESKISEEKTTSDTKIIETKSTTLIKSIYKDLVRRDPIHRNLIQNDDDDDETHISRTTPIKKPTETKERTPLSCVANRTRSARPMKPKNLLGNVFEDNFSPKIEETREIDENTPIQATGQKLGGKTTSNSQSITKSKSKIPVIRSRRLH